MYQPMHIRLHKNTPCVQVGKCVDCQSDDRICSAVCEDMQDKR